MPFVLILEIEGERCGRTYRDPAEAHQCYEEACRVCMDGPDDADGMTPYLISNCWLYNVQTADSDAVSAAMSGQGELIASFDQ